MNSEDRPFGLIPPAWPWPETAAQIWTSFFTSHEPQFQRLRLERMKLIMDFTLYGYCEDLKHST